MNEGKLITELMEATEIPDDSAYLLRMGDGTGTKQVKHRTLSKEVVRKAEIPDLSGVLGGKGENVNFQQLIDAIADRVMTKLVEKSRVANNSLTTEEGFILDARVAKVHQDEIDKINSNLIILKTVNLTDAQGNTFLGYTFNNTDAKVLFAVCITKSYYVGRLFLNNYGMWYVTLYNADGTQVTTPVDVTLIVGYVNISN